MNRFILSVITFSLITVVIAGCGSGHKSPQVSTELEGVWTTTMPETEILPEINVIFTFHGDTWELLELETETSATVVQLSGTFTCDPESNPRELDLYITDSSSELQDAGTTLYGIYDINGDNLTVAFGEDDTRPAAFTAYNTIELAKE